MEKSSECHVLALQYFTKKNFKNEKNANAKYILSKPEPNKFVIHDGKILNWNVLLLNV